MPPIIDRAGPIDASRDQRPVVAVVEVSYWRRDRSRLRRADEGTNVLVVTPFLFLSGKNEKLELVHVESGMALLPRAFQNPSA
jgi:hypothetical protein